MYSIRVTPLALQDLHEIKEYITETLDNAQAAHDTMQAIIQAYEKLADFPMMGAKLTHIIDLPTDFRFIVCRKYLVFYRVEEKFISVHRILYHKRDFIKILFKNHDEREGCYHSV